MGRPSQRPSSSETASKKPKSMGFLDRITQIFRNFGQILSGFQSLVGRITANFFSNPAIKEAAKKTAKKQTSKPHLHESGIAFAPASTMPDLGQLEMTIGNEIATSDRALLIALGYISKDEYKVSADELRKRISRKLVRWNIFGSGVERSFHPDFVEKLKKVETKISNLARSGDEEAKGFLAYVKKAATIKYALGGWNFRKVKGRKKGNETTDLSNHSYGTALDIMPEDNSRGKEGVLAKRFPRILQIFRDEGIICGADWLDNRDDMHFEYHPYKKPGIELHHEHG